MNALVLSQHIESEYKSYLKTQFHFRDPELRRQFSDALDSGRLVNGPLLELTPLFDRAGAPGDLLEEVVGIPKGSGFSRALNELTSNLHRHQEQAIRAVLSGRNAVVATGTGSGKTESFLYSVLAHLYKEHVAGQLRPGVRALILYPMNALANDQRERMGSICTKLGEFDREFRITFGEYTGHTPESERDGFRNGPERVRNRLTGELVLREEMRAQPPHILLTNYSMLEYMLLRPHDSRLFDNGAGSSWQFLVLDEAHQYRGARGIEMAMLLRRLKRRLVEGGLTKKLRCIATSATLADGPNARGPVAEFANRLFDEPFQPEDIILAEERPQPSPIKGLRVSAIDLISVRDALNRRDADAIANLATRYGIDSMPEIATTLGALLDRDERVAMLRVSASEGARTVDSILEELFPEIPSDNRTEALVALIDLLTAARHPSDGTALLQARFHLFVRALEGAFLQFFPTLQLRLDRAAPEEHDEKGATFELALCRECGQHYLLAQRELAGGKVVEPVRDPDDDRFGVTYLRPIADIDVGNDEEDEGEEVNKRWQLCLRCGRIDEDEPQCGHSMSVEVVAEHSADDAGRADQLKRCGVCGYSASGKDPVREIVHGADGPNVVIATALVRYQSYDRRKVLAFTDSRQSAAFFAWFLQDSYRDIQSRNLILRAANRLRRAADLLTMQELCHELLRDMEEAETFSESDGIIDRKREAWKRIFREFLTDERRISLEGVGVVQWLLVLPQSFVLPRLLLEDPWSLSVEQAGAIVTLLLDSMRHDRAIRPDEVEPGVLLRWDDLELTARNRSARLGAPRGQSNVIAWDGPRTRRVRLLKSILLNKGWDESRAIEYAQRALRAIWEQCQQYTGSTSKDTILQPVNDACVLNWRWYRLRVNTEKLSQFRCELCGRLYASNVIDICRSSHCQGRLHEVRLSDPAIAANHYRGLYIADDLPMRFRVEEHTAQIEHTEASRFQRDFRDKQIQVLSCSTTFELGVDLGDLDTILLRNVPPEPFNYAQRAGRSGRRNTPGFVVTFCRRDPHDLQHFRTPDRMIAGRTGPPVLTVVNSRIIVRHMTAVALSSYLRANPQRFGGNKVKDFLLDLTAPSAREDLYTFIEQRRSEFETSLRTIVPAGAWDETGLSSGEWMEHVAGVNSNLALAEDQSKSDFEAVQLFEAAALRDRKFNDLKWATNRARTMEEEDVLGYLSRRTVIPKYGFPVDVVELDTQPGEKRRVNTTLARDLSIAVGEYAPECDVVANKRQWSSYALKRVPEREWDEYFFARCTRHHVFADNKVESGAVTALSCGCPPQSSKYVIPIFGFTTSRNGSTDPRRYRTREFTTRPHFAGTRNEPSESMLIPIQRPVLTISPASPGWMVVLCEGPRNNGFYICRRCGFGSRQRKRSHDDPRGYSCSGMLEALSLGHRFCTDVVRLQFRLAPDPRISSDSGGLMHSLAQAIAMAAARVLEVERDDLSAVVATVAKSTSGVSPIILYDTVPGGAGLVARLAASERILYSCLLESRSIVSGDCGCDPMTSCDGCLRTYRNRYLYEHLRRGLALEYLNQILDEWTPATKSLN